MTDPMTLIMSIPGIGPYIPWLTLAVTVASGLATVMPPPTATSGKIYTTVYSVVHYIALNFGHGKAATAAQVSGEAK